jgi:Trypsin-like peptidase domain
MWARFSKAAALALVIAPAAAAQTPASYARDTVLPITMQIAATDVRARDLSGTGLLWRGRVAHTSTVAAIRLHVVVSGAGGPWQLVVRSELTGAIADTYDSSSAWAARGDFWTRDVAGAAALVDLLASGDCSRLTIVIDKYAYAAAPLQKQSIFGVDGRIPVLNASARIRDMGKSVARLRIMIPGLGQATCTGWAVTDSLVFTNEHCVGSVADARSTLVDWGYDGPASAIETVRADDLVALSHDLDYALLHLEKPLAAKWPPLELSSREAAENEDLILIEHPLGGFKQASLESCEVSALHMPGVSAGQTDFGHRCDTLNGSSGSPVISDASGKVVGLHHFGFDAATNTYVNRAVSIGLIVADVDKSRPALLPRD